MTNDIGMIKTAPQVAQSSPAASTGRPVADAQVKADPRLAREANEARGDESAEPLATVVSDLNKLVRDLHRELKFSVDEDSGDTVIKVIDKATDEVVRQIPSEELMHLRKRLEQAAGVIFHDSA